MKSITVEKALKMTQQERVEYMGRVKAALASGKISREQADSLREPIKAAIVATF